jgi:hypothetical protein
VSGDEVSENSFWWNTGTGDEVSCPADEVSRRRGVGDEVSGDEVSENSFGGTPAPARRCLAGDEVSGDEVSENSSG